MLSSVRLPQVVADVGPGGVYPTTAAAFNALQKQRLENQYYLPIQQADAMSKLAYSQFAGPEALAKFISTPGVANNMKPEDFQKFQNYFQNMVSTPGLGMYNPFSNAQQNQGLGDYLLSGAFNAVRNLFGNKPNQENPVNSLNYPPMKNNSSNTPNSQNKVTGSVSASSAGYNTPGSQIAGELVKPGTMGGLNPNVGAEAQGKALETTVTGQAANQNAEQTALNEKVNAQSSAAIPALKSLDGWYNAYKKSSYKGQYLGSRPASGTGSIPTLPGGTVAPEQLADTFQQQFLQAISTMEGNGGGITDDARSLLSESKGLSRQLDDDAAKVLYDSTKAKLERIINSRNFLNDFYKNNPTATKEQAVAMMNAYNRYAPSYDYENFESIPRNEKKFKDFTSRRALDSYMKNGDYNPYENEKKIENNISGKITDTQMIGNDQYVKINNEWHKRVR